MNDINPEGSAAITPILPFTQSMGQTHSDLLLSGNKLYGVTENDVFCVSDGGGLLWNTPISSSYGSPFGDLCFEVPPIGLAGSTPGIILGTIPGNLIGPNYTSLGYVFELQSDGGTFSGGAYVNYSALPQNFPSSFLGANPGAGLIQGPSGLILDATPTIPNTGIYGVGNSYDFYGAAGQQQTTIFAVDSGTLFKLHLVTGATVIPFRYPLPGGQQGTVINWSDPPNVALQSTPVLTGPWTNVIGATPPYTNFASAKAQFFRLMISATNLPALAPALTTLPVNGIGSTNATLSGQVIPNAANTMAWFEYGATTSYGAATPATFVSLTNAMVVRNVINGLQAGATYHYNLVASNNIGTATGGDLTFTVSPAVTTLPAIDVTSNGDTNATYQYISNVFTNQGRTYGIGVDVLPGAP